MASTSRRLPKGVAGVIRSRYLRDPNPPDPEIIVIAAGAYRRMCMRDITPKQGAGVGIVTAALIDDRC